MLQEWRTVVGEHVQLVICMYKYWHTWDTQTCNKRMDADWENEDITVDMTEKVLWLGTSPAMDHKNLFEISNVSILRDNLCLRSSPTLLFSQQYRKEASFEPPLMYMTIKL